LATDVRNESFEESRPVILFSGLAGLLFWSCHGDRLLRVGRIPREASLNCASLSCWPSFDPGGLDASWLARRPEMKARTMALRGYAPPWPLALEDHVWVNDHEGNTIDPKPDPEGQECACPTDSRIARHFDAKVAERLARGDDPGLVAVSERLRDALLSLDPTGRTVLELGCGRGGLLLALVQAGVASASGVDLSAASIDAARTRFEQMRLSDRVQLSVGDAARVPLESHDWVILDRVMCCYPDIERLLANTLPAARQIYAFTVPSSRGWRGVLARLDEWVENAWNRLRGRPCPGYVHDLDLIEERLTTAGFRLRHRDRQRLWHIAIYEKERALTTTGDR
jgi:Methylase involved in ubiquinone/menaquinone biosynthesis